MSTPTFTIVAQRFDQYGNPLPIQNLIQDSNGNYLIPAVITGQTINIFGVVNGTAHATTYSQWGSTLGTSPISNLGYNNGESNPLVLHSTDIGKSGTIQLQIFGIAGSPPTVLTQNFIVQIPPSVSYGQSNCGQTIALFNNSPVTINSTGLTGNFSIKFVSVGADPKVISSSLYVRGFVPNALENTITLLNDGDMVELNFDANNDVLQVVDRVVASQGTGTVGPIGPAGPAGPRGIQGIPGPQGIQGPVGPTGATGVAGPQGPKGDTGATGPAGVAGPTGATGVAGPQGIQGATGSQGIPGPAGPIGATGSQGPKGDTGSTGPAGAVGPQGPIGPAGPKGDTGAVGPQGIPGPAGPAGAGSNVPPTLFVGPPAL